MVSTEFWIQATDFVKEALDLCGIEDRAYFTYQLQFHGEARCSNGYTECATDCPHNTKPKLGVHSLDTRHHPYFTLGTLLGPTVSITCRPFLRKFSFLVFDLISDKDPETARMIFRTFSRRPTGTEELVKRESELKLTGDTSGDCDKANIRAALSYLLEDGPGKETPLGKALTQLLNSVDDKLWKAVPDDYWGKLKESKTNNMKSTTHDDSDT